MDILFSCYRAAFSPNDQYFIEQALNADDTPADTTPCSPVHAMALYAKEVSGSPGRLTVPKKQIEDFDANDKAGNEYIANLVIARSGDKDPVVFFNVSHREEEVDHTLTVSPRYDTPIAVTTQPIKSSMIPSRRDLYFSQQKRGYITNYLSDPESAYNESTLVFLYHDLDVPTADVERELNGFVPVEWRGAQWFTPLSHVGRDFFSSTASDGPEAVCSAVRVSHTHRRSFDAVSFI